MKQLTVSVEPKTTIKDLVEGFLFCTDRLEFIDEYFDSYSPNIPKAFIVEGLTEKGKKLLENNLINNPNPHTQLLNQMQFRIQIFNTTRAVLQEFARHRVGWEITVKSTRYALHKIAEDDRINSSATQNKFVQELTDVIGDYYFIPEFVEEIHEVVWLTDRWNDLMSIKELRGKGIKNDYLKAFVNDYMLTDINVVCSAQALRNFFVKRLSKRAFPQIRTLAEMMYKNIPDDLKFLFSVFEWKKVKLSDYMIENNQAWDQVLSQLPEEMYIKESLTKDLT